MSSGCLSFPCVAARLWRRLIFILIPVVVLSNEWVQGQADTSYSFMVAGHAYGAHSGTNPGLHPALLESLNEGYDPDAAFIIFTGDIVNYSSTDSWNQVASELAAYPIGSYYVMGNHDDNAAGLAAFNDKHGGTYYSFFMQHSLFIVLNSTQEERSISAEQITFLEEELQTMGDSIKNVFIFFHEILWNSDEKYIDVRSNSRSRYDQIRYYSNYWEEVHPLLVACPAIDFYVIAGDVGGNADAVAAFYDKRDNVILIASGMGEVADENYLNVRMANEDSIVFSLVPLRDILLEPLITYSVPPATEGITGPDHVRQSDTDILYSVPPVFNAGSYIWDLSDGMTGESASASISVSFSSTFTEGTLSVRAARDGFGSGPASQIHIIAEPDGLRACSEERSDLRIDLDRSVNALQISYFQREDGPVDITVFSISGSPVYAGSLLTTAGQAVSHTVELESFPGGLYILHLSDGRSQWNRLFCR